MQSIDILGCRVDAVSAGAAVDRIAQLAAGPAGSLIVTLGVEMVMAARRDREFRAIVNGAALSVCDTIGLLLASRLRGGPLRSRVTGIGLLSDLAARSAGRGDVRLYFLGGAGDTAQRAATHLLRRFPNARIVGTHDGYFADPQSERIAATIAATGANVLCVGLGSPKQERWFARYGAQTGCGAGIGVGGAFDVLAGNVERAPRFVQRAGLEWAYRLLREPSRWRRQLVLPQFALAVALDAAHARSRRSESCS